MSAAALVAAVCCARVTFGGLTDVTLLDGSGVHPSSFPSRLETAPPTVPLVYSFHLRAGPLAPQWYLVVPDDHVDSVAIDMREVPLSGVTPEKLDDYEVGLAWPLGCALGPGDHTVVVRVLDRAGPGGLDVRVDPWRGLGGAEILAAFVATLVLLVAAMRAARCRRSTIVLGAVAVTERIGYLLATPYRLRAHDPDSHLQYVTYLLEHRAVPHAKDGFEFYHPPLYYFSSALVEACLRALGFQRGVQLAALQLESMAFELGFAAFAVATARLFIDRLPDAPLGRRLWSRDGLAALATALILFWPSSVVHSTRIGNDDLTYLCFGGALYFASRWWLAGREGKLSHFLAAAGFGALGLVTKTNSLVVFAVLGVLVVARLLRDREQRVRLLARYGGPLAASFVVASGLALHEAVVGLFMGDKGDFLIPNAEQNAGELIVGNRAENYLWFDLRTYVTQAFTSAWDEDKGRQYFWNYLLKTGLFGEWGYSKTATWNLAVLMSLACLAMLVTVVVGVLLLRRAQLGEELPLLATAVLLVASLALVRMKIPRSCTGDFRYVLPIILPLAYGYVRALVGYRERGWTRAASGGLVLGWVFAALSVAFIAVVVVVGKPW
ncbi:MAG TPA: hypothetical protein VIF09_08770 [Polyangiaceae bacterium]